jgi:hypothetical protein
MKAAIKSILGKRITGVVNKRHATKDPSSQLFLLFEDDTFYEFWTNGPEISGVGRIDFGGRDQILASGRKDSEIVVEVYL